MIFRYKYLLCANALSRRASFAVNIDRDVENALVAAERKFGPTKRSIRSPSSSSLLHE